MQELTKTEIAKIRAELRLAGYSTQQAADHLGVTRGMVNAAIAGSTRSDWVQSFIATQIKRWPWPWEQGARRIREE